MKFFEDKVIWITGASSGIGRALAIELAAQKCKLALSARSVQDLEEVAIECRILGSEALVVPLDLENAEIEGQIALSKIHHSFGYPDILVNNAGVSQRSLALETSIALDRKLMEINFFGSVVLSKLVADIMVKRRFGFIVVVSSILGDYGQELHTTYAAAKHATNGWFESFRDELKDTGVIVQVVSPGFIQTNVSKNALLADGSKWDVMSPAQEKGMPASVFARKMLKGIESGRSKVYIGGKELLAVLIHKFSPSLFYFLMGLIKKK